MQLTKKVNDKRVMRSLPLWKCLNTKTPYSWFEKYDGFLTALSYELGFVSVQTTSIEEIGGDNLYCVMTFTHKEGQVIRFTLLRGYQFSGGAISLRLEKKETQLFMTASASTNGVIAEDRTRVGDWFIEQIRDNWKLF
jgi:hypothetical protein